jgi:pilus assembly protein CpaC
MKFKLLFILTGCVVLFAFSFLAVSQSYMFEEENDETVKLVIGEVSIFHVVTPERVSIRNPDIADVSKVTDTEVVIVAKLGGDTVLTLWDKQGRREYNISVLPRDLEIVQDKLKELINKNLRIADVYFRKNEVTGRVMVLGQVSPVQKEHIEKILEIFADNVDNLLTLEDESKMVEIDCQILEMSRNDVESMGIKWQEFLQLREEPYTGSTSSNTAAVNTTLNKVAPWSKLWPIKQWSRDALHARIDMLISNGKGRILSRPKLLCLSGKEARLVVGGEVPYVSASATNNVGTQVEVEYRDYGVILELKPIITDDDQIILDISTEVSELDTVNGFTVASITVPAFTKREAQTVLNVVSGDTIFIGGLIQNQQAKTIEKVPALGNIPILGALFRSKDFQDDETELIITLTPTLVQSKKKGKAIQFSEGPKSTLPNKMAIFPEYLQQEGLLSDYILRVQRMVAQSLNYPRLAEDAGWQGTVKLKIHINYDGEILEVKVSEPSGYVSFDNSVLAAVKALGPYPPFPPSVEVEDLWIDLPIVYRMD